MTKEKLKTESHKGRPIEFSFDENGLLGIEFDDYPCSYRYMSEAKARELRDWLNRAFPDEPKCEHGKCITGNADCAIGTTTTCAKCGEPICAGCGRIRRRESSDEPQIVGWHDTKTGESGELCTLCGTTFRDGEANGLCGERGPWRCNKPYGHSGMHQAGPNPLQEYGWEDDETNATLCSCGAIGDFHEEGCSALNRRAEPT